MASQEITVWAADEVMTASTLLADVDESLKNKYYIDLVSLKDFIKSASLAVRQIRILGITGDAYIQVFKGRKYIIFKGYAGQRAALNGTRYLASNPKVAMFVVGTREIIKDAAKATKIAVIAYVALDIVSELLQDHFSLARLGVKVASDIAKAVASAVIGAAAGVALSVAGVPVVVAFRIFVGISVAAGIALEWLDQKYHVTDNAVKRMMGYEAAVKAELKEISGPLSEIAGKAEKIAGQTAHSIAIHTKDIYWRSINELLSAEESLAGSFGQ